MGRQPEERCHVHDHHHAAVHLGWLPHLPELVGRAGRRMVRHPRGRVRRRRRRAPAPSRRAVLPRPRAVGLRPGWGPGRAGDGPWGGRLLGRGLHRAGTPPVGCLGRVGSVRLLHRPRLRRRTGGVGLPGRLRGLLGVLGELLRPARRRHRPAGRDARAPPAVLRLVLVATRPRLRLHRDAPPPTGACSRSPTRDR